MYLQRWMIEELAREPFQRLLRLVQRTQSWVDEGRVDDEAAVRWSDWIEPLLRRESYLALLVERPAVHEQLLRLLGAARWPAEIWAPSKAGPVGELAARTRSLVPRRISALVPTSMTSVLTDRVSPG